MTTVKNLLPCQRNPQAWELPNSLSNTMAEQVIRAVYLCRTECPLLVECGKWAAKAPSPGTVQAGLVYPANTRKKVGPIDVATFIRRCRPGRPIKAASSASTTVGGQARAL